MPKKDDINTYYCVVTTMWQLNNLRRLAEKYNYTQTSWYISNKYTINCAFVVVEKENKFLSKDISSMSAYRAIKLSYPKIIKHIHTKPKRIINDLY